MRRERTSAFFAALGLNIYQPRRQGAQHILPRSDGSKPVQDRLIRKEMPKSDSLNECSREAYLFWPWLTMAADNHGRFDASPRSLRADLFPYREDVTGNDIQGWLDEFERVGQIKRWKFEGRVFGELANYAKYHRDNRFQRRASRFPKPDEIIEQKVATASTRVPQDIRDMLQQLYPGRANETHLQKIVGWMFGRDLYTSQEVLHALEMSRGKEDPLSYAASVMRHERDKKKIEAEPERRIAGKKPGF